MARIVSSGTYTPKRIVSSEELDQLRGWVPGSAQKRSGVATRHWATTEETSSLMAAEALRNTAVELSDLDAVLVATVAPEQPMPSTAVLVARRLSLPPTVTAFDLNMSCLGFLGGLDLAATMVDAGRWRCAAVVAVDVPSVAVDPHDPETAALFGDGAAAAIVRPGQMLTPGKFETHAAGADLCRIQVGGTRYNQNRPHPHDISGYFEMNGLGVMKFAAKRLPSFVDELLTENSLVLSDIDLVIPHQASGLGLRYLRKMLGLREDQIVDIISDYGNQVSASLPFALHSARSRFTTGANVLLLGTGAGLTIGGMILKC